MGKQIIGRNERISFPVLGLEKVEAKVDTGAYSSSIHCINVRMISRKAQMIEFTLVPPLVKEERVVKRKLLKKARVTSSNGQSSTRYLVELKVQIGDRLYETPFSLADREEMTFPVLLGRRLLNKFLVDSSKSYLTD